MRTHNVLLALGKLHYQMHSLNRDVKLKADTHTLTHSQAR